MQIAILIKWFREMFPLRITNNYAISKSIIDKMYIQKQCRI